MDLVVIVNRNENVKLLAKAVMKINPTRIVIATTVGCGEAHRLYGILLNKDFDVKLVEVCRHDSAFAMTETKRFFDTLKKSEFIVSEFDCVANMFASHSFIEGNCVSMYKVDTQGRKLVKQSDHFASAGKSMATSLDDVGDVSLVDFIARKQPKKMTPAIESLLANQLDGSTMFPEVKFTGFDGVNHVVRPTLYRNYNGVEFVVWVAETTEKLVESIAEASATTKLNGALFAMVYTTTALVRTDEICGILVASVQASDTAGWVEHDMEKVIDAGK